MIGWCTPASDREISASEPFPTDVGTLGAVVMRKSDLSPRTLHDAWLATRELLLR
jgi:hypothetical protein